MGTNYYAVQDYCPACGREDRFHICKSHITFRGHFHQVSNDGGTTWESEPWLTSWQEWKAFLRSPEIDAIFDEYGKRHDVEDFIRAVEATSREARRRQYDWVVAHPEPYRKFEVVPDGEWLDADGFSFYGGSFS
jgi:hypothetical protein